MEYRSYNKELAYANILFKRPFSNIKIERDGKEISVNCLFSNRSRIFKDFENADKRATYKLPMIFIERKSISVDEERRSNVWNEVRLAKKSGELDYNLFTPVPINISYEVTIVSKYQTDIDMILANFIPFFNADLYFSSEHPKFPGIMTTNQVILDSSISEEHPSELESSADDFITATCTFTYKTSIFCGNETFPYTYTTITSIDLAFYDPPRSLQHEQFMTSVDMWDLSGLNVDPYKDKIQVK